MFGETSAKPHNFLRNRKRMDGVRRAAARAKAIPKRAKEPAPSHPRVPGGTHIRWSEGHLAFQRP